MLKEKNKSIPYKLVIICNSYVGNFERELIAYSMGVLDNVQINIGFAKEERNMFWQDVEGKDAPEDFDDYQEHSTLLKEYLLETCSDDGYNGSFQTFYAIDVNSDFVSEVDEIMGADSSAIIIDMCKPFDGKWEDIVINRMQDFANQYFRLSNGDKIDIIGIRLYKTSRSPYKIEKEYI